MEEGGRGRAVVTGGRCQSFGHLLCDAAAAARGRTALTRPGESKTLCQNHANRYGSPGEIWCNYQCQNDTGFWQQLCDGSLWLLGNCFADRGLSSGGVVSSVGVVCLHQEQHPPIHLMSANEMRLKEGTRQRICVRCQSAAQSRPTDGGPNL
ncbi:hypothetical protein LSTR_LSTR008055 [Laodelphax striatellus]|uniref:Uncharacterized protein n=1 Tax=Laodelphax striatellus TaxID=195883 RepID=A0A482XLV8_LAOST|nr:hypothetical protein LSTR_LSTR008055 [Laodelphax striatellus]